MEIETKKPVISIIIPTWRDSKVLNKCLDSLDNLDYPFDKLEVLLSTKVKPDSELNRNYKIQLIIIPDNCNHATARNIAAEKACGEYIAFLDDDCIVPPDWLKTGLKYFFSPNIGLVGGPGIAPEKMNFAEKLAYYTVSSPYATGYTYSRFRNTGIFLQADENFFLLCNNIMKKYIFDEIGGFYPQQVPCEENYLYAKIIEKGYILIYASEFEVIHKVKPINEMLRKIFWYASGRGSYIFKYPQFNKKPRLYIPIVFLFSIAGLPVLGYLLNSIFIDLWFLELVSYIALMCAHITYIFYKEDKNPVLWVILPFLAFSMHILYACGVVNGFLLALLKVKNTHVMPEIYKNN